MREIVPENWRELRAHELAEMLPEMPAADFEAFTEDMARDGYDRDQPIVLYEGRILDGRHRQRSCVRLDHEGRLRVEPSFVEFDGSDPALFVLQRNINRRHLIQHQKVLAVMTLRDRMVVESREIQLANLIPGAIHRERHSGVLEALNATEPKPKKKRPASEDAVVEITGAGRGTVSRCAYLHRHDPEAAKKVLKGEEKMMPALERAGWKDSHNRRGVTRGQTQPKGKPTPRLSRSQQKRLEEELRKEMAATAKPGNGAAIPVCRTDRYSKLGINTPEVMERTVTITGDPATAAAKLAWHFDREGMRGLFYHLKQYLSAETLEYVATTYGEERSDVGFESAHRALA